VDMCVEVDYLSFAPEGTWVSLGFAHCVVQLMRWGFRFVLRRCSMI